MFDGINIQQYSIREEPLVGEAKEEVQNYDLMSAVMICLGEETGKNYVGRLPRTMDCSNKYMESRR